MFHVALIFLFATKKQIIPRALANVPHLQLASDADQFIALGDPTLFARPNAHDLASDFWRRLPAAPQPDFNWTEDPRYLPPVPGEFGAAFREYMRHIEPPALPLNVKPEPKFVPLAVTAAPAMPPATTMKISGELAARRWLNRIDLPSLPRNDVIAPSTVQVLVDAAGNVFSAVVLKPDAGIQSDSDADQTALQLARSLRFAPAAGPTLGEVTFTWRTVPAGSAAPSLQ